MSLLNQIIKEAKSNPKGVEESWLTLRNTYFRGDDPFQQIEDWANENNLVAYFVDGGPFHGNPPKNVHFRAKAK